VLYRIEDKKLAAFILLTIIKGEEYRFIARLIPESDPYYYIWTPGGAEQTIYFKELPKINPNNVYHKIRTYLTFQ
jgi:hypothetical protein